MAQSRVKPAVTTGLEAVAAVLFVAGLVLAFGVAAAAAFTGACVCVGASYLLVRR